ncbi:PKD domain-containing protein [Candidatus Falkowbacteria bacterium]|nr:PKD domain-containing protein [Candidatus Falkowbacteria bacterium]
MKLHICLFIFLLTCFMACDGPEQMHGSSVDDNNPANPQTVCDRDGLCEAHETEENCPADCTPEPVCDNDGNCEAGETQQNCPNDCNPAPICDNDGTCEAGETQQNCPNDCPPPGENHAPTFTPIDSITVVVGTNISFQVQATDADNDKVTLSWVIPNGASFSNVTNNAVTVTGNFSWTPSSAGTYTAKFTATDNNDEPKSSTMTVNITVTATPPPDHITGTLSYAGLNYIFDFTAQKITLTNSNPYVVRLSGNFYNNKIMETSATQTFNAGFSQGQQIEIKVWKGEAATWYPDLHGQNPDLIGRVVLAAGTMNANTAYSEWASYVGLFTPQTGINCQLSGRYNKADVTLQSNHTLYCYNSSSNYPKVELFHIVPTSGNKYKNDAKLGTILSITPDSEEIIKINYTYASAADLVAVRVTAATQSVNGYMLDMTRDEVTKLNVTVEIID